jgi:hypothetical protein
MSEWNPIETAPRDRHLLLYGRQLEPHDAVTYKEALVFSGYWDSLDQAWCSTASAWTGPFFDPTHWADLPPPPPEVTR